MIFSIPPTHPRAKSLHTRELLVNGFRKGLVVTEGLIAHGRGEAFDYLIGEETSTAARRAIIAAGASLLLAKKPVISVNGNAAALCAGEIVGLANEVNANIEVNLFYRTEQRERVIKKELEMHGAKIVLGVGDRASASIPELHGERRRVDPDGILSADTVFVPLEDGDRTEALVRMGKTVIAVDLNPVSRTAKAAQITIIDNFVRALPAMILAVRDLKNHGVDLKSVLATYDNNNNLAQSLALIKGGIQ